MAQELGVQNRLLFLGYMNAPYRYYHLMDAFAMCSNSEGFGLALLEAMQLGTPIVCTNLPIYNDYFNENEVGLFEFDDQDSFNKAVDKVLMQNEYYKEKFGNPIKEKTAMLIPVTVELTGSDNVIFKENIAFMNSLGFKVEEFGINSYIIK